MRSTRQRGSTYETTEVCGGGITLETNLFVDLTPIIQSSNGGAISLECDFVSIDASTDFGASNQVGLATNIRRNVMFSDFEFYTDSSGTVTTVLPVYKAYKNTAML
jgi:hypothetical protein